MSTNIFYREDVQIHTRSTTAMLQIGLMAALMALCALISIPTTIPFTLQTFAIFFALRLLGGQRGTAAICVYLLLGLVGVPVFPSFTAGLGVLFGPTGGYLLGFAVGGLTVWLLEKLPLKGCFSVFTAMLVFLLACYIPGTAWFMFISAQEASPISLSTALSLCVLPFILPDILKLLLAETIAQRLKKIVK